MQKKDDLISRQAVIDAVEKWFFDTTDLRQPKEVLCCVSSAQPELHWIPCSERYPEQDEGVIVTCDGYDFHVWDCMSNRGDDYFWEDELGLYHNKYEVIAWMPLIKPYKEREDR